MQLLIWLGGMAAFWVGAGVAAINGYPLRPGLTLGAALLLGLAQYAAVWRLQWGQGPLGALVLGLAPAALGFYLPSGHWVSEVLIVGLLMSLAALQALLARSWRRQWAAFAIGGADRQPEGALGGLVYTLANVVLIIGLLLIWHFPATPLPGREGAWGLVALAVVNQELIKRKYYGNLNGAAILAWTSAALVAGLSFWLLAVVYLRAWG